jgi:hypothetical protein
MDWRSKADVPGQQLSDPVDRMVGDTADHLAQIGFGIEALSPKRLCALTLRALNRARTTSPRSEQ